MLHNTNITMNKQYHILNGDALKEQFPAEIEGNIIVARECLVDGPVESKSLDEFYRTRAEFISTAYGGYSPEDYDGTITEFEKVQAIPNNSELNLWFEDDLFCQVNLWFVAHLIAQSSNQYTVFLIRPNVHTPYGFGGLNKEELQTAHNNRLPIRKLDTLANMWTAYQDGDTELLLQLAKSLGESYAFMLPAVQAHLDRIPIDSSNSRPMQSLHAIIDELQTDQFGPVFREFNQRESIYGFGDLQVKRMFDLITQQRSSR